MAPRLYSSSQLQAGTLLALTPDRSYYLSTVLRAQPGMEVRVFNAACGEWQAIIIAQTKKTVTLELVRCVCPPASEPVRTLIFAPIKRTPLEWLIEKATELGVTEFIPVLTERTQVRSLNLERLESIAIEAAEQCERLSIPVFRQPIALSTLLARWQGQRVIHAALERTIAQPMPVEVIAENILIGPEGGFSDAEQALLQAQVFVRPVTLGPRILRAETAAIAALSWLAVQDQ